MRVFTAHLRPGRAPVLVPERFSWGAFLFGPFWLVAHRAWIAAAVLLLAVLLVPVVPIPAWRPWAGLALCVLAGLFGQDLRRWALARRGFVLAQVVAAADADAALLRLAEAEPSAVLP